MSKDEKWKQAEGVTGKGTNSVLASRDYSVKCSLSMKPITFYKGYHIWWCESHHQPHAKCKIRRNEKENQRLRSLLGDAEECFRAWKAGIWKLEGKDPEELTNEFLNRIEQVLEETE